MNAAQKRQEVVDQYKTILRPNIYSQDATKRECAFTPYKDGKYYSDCSSSIRLAYMRAAIGLNNIGGNTVGMYNNAAGVIVECAIKSGVPTDIKALRVGDILLFAGTDTSRSASGYVGHVEMVYKIDGDTVTLCGHGSGNPSAKPMTTYCKQRQAAKTSTKRGNKGLIKVVRFIPDDAPSAQDDAAPTVYPAMPTPEAPPAPVHGVRITGGLVNLRTGPGTSYGIARTAKKGEVLTSANFTGWRPILVDGQILYVSESLSEEV